MTWVEWDPVAGRLVERTVLPSTCAAAPADERRAVVSLGDGLSIGPAVHTYPNVERGDLSQWAADVEQETAYASREWIARRVRGYKLAAEILAARDAAHAKHGDDSIEGMDGRDPRWLAVLVEEVGEIARALTYDSGATDEDLEGELVDVLAVASAWLDSVRSRRVAAAMAAADAEAAGDTRPTS